MPPRESSLHRFGIPAGPGLGNQARSRHLSHIQRIRERTLPRPPHQEFGALELSIPELDYYVLLERFPDLKSPDAETKVRAWKKFLASELSDPYRLNRRARKSK